MSLDYYLVCLSCRKKAVWIGDSNDNPIPDRSRGELVKFVHEHVSRGHIGITMEWDSMWEYINSKSKNENESVSKSENDQSNHA